jgi:hypothetical protein
VQSVAREFGSIRKLPSGRFQARYRAPDSGELTPATVTFTSKKAASAWLADVQSDIERGRWKSPEQLAAEKAEAAVAAAETLTVAQVADIWLETIPSDNHRVTSAGRVRRFINPELGGIPITELTKTRCDRWHHDMEERLCSGANPARFPVRVADHVGERRTATRGVAGSVEVQPLGQVSGSHVGTVVGHPPRVPRRGVVDGPRQGVGHFRVPAEGDARRVAAVVPRVAARGVPARCDG